MWGQSSPDCLKVKDPGPSLLLNQSNSPHCSSSLKWHDKKRQKGPATSWSFCIHLDISAGIFYSWEYPAHTERWFSPLKNNNPRQRAIALDVMLKIKHLQKKAVTLHLALLGALLHSASDLPRLHFPVSSILKLDLNVGFCPSSLKQDWSAQQKLYHPSQTMLAIRQEEDKQTYEKWNKLNWDTDYEFAPWTNTRRDSR